MSWTSDWSYELIEVKKGELIANLRSSLKYQWVQSAGMKTVSGMHSPGELSFKGGLLLWQLSPIPEAAQHSTQLLRAGHKLHTALTLDTIPVPCIKRRLSRVVFLATEWVLSLARRSRRVRYPALLYLSAALSQQIRWETKQKNTWYKQGKKALNMSWQSTRGIISEAWLWSSFFDRFWYTHSPIPTWAIAAGPAQLCCTLHMYWAGSLLKAAACSMGHLRRVPAK